MLRTLAILKTFAFRTFFFEKWLHAHVFGGAKVKELSASELASALDFVSWWHQYIDLAKFWSTDKKVRGM